ncbi:MAG: hypothetical protein JWN83_1243 [Chitinophagaceae bacterium]|nr:hypothetical protein [Chitinophagaceae bacterium]
MKHSFKPLTINVAMAAVMALTSCQKEAGLHTTDIAAIQAAVAQTQAIAVSISATTPGDSIYIVNTCSRESKRDTIAFSNLPSSVAGYLNTNYPAYSFQKAFTIKDAAGTLQGYVAIILFNGNPVGLKFDAGGAFVQVLEQREGRDLLGNGHHEGGCFQNRDGKQRDTIAISALPTSITSYFASNYASDTLVRASKTRDSGYIVLSKNNGLFATVFNVSGNFISRVELPAPRGKANSIEQSALPANTLSYLSATYPNYVFNKAFSITVNGVVQGYCVVIEANNTKYAVQFNAAGIFVKAKPIR